MGSGAAVSVAILRAFSACMGHSLSDEQVSNMAFEVEVIHHGNPSGIDNTVITYARPVYYIKGKTIETLQVKQPFNLVIGDTGVRSPTASAVSDVHQGWENEREQFEDLFDAIGKIAASARKAIEAGSNDSIGPLMDENHALLSKMGVSSPELDRIVNAARFAGALGAKLSGAGRGGNMIAMVTPESFNRVAQAITEAGAVRTILTEIRAT
jgi:mevalonate kinase